MVKITAAGGGVGRHGALTSNHDPIVSGLGFERDRLRLLLEVNKALTQVYVSGDIDVIFRAWLGKLGRPSGLLAAMYLLNAIPE